MADCLFAKYQLEKHGWTEGAGLGKHEDGIINPIQVALKNNKDGIGHIPGSDLTKNWWDQVYNEAASQISVKTAKKDVAPCTTEIKVSSKNTSLLYSNFVKGPTLNASGETFKEQEESSESDSEKELIPPRLTDEEILKICGGRTAHKAAGHGIKLNGKLQRIQEQERQYQESLNKEADSVCNFSNLKPPHKKKHGRVAEEEVLLKEEIHFQEKKCDKKRKKEAKKDELDEDFSGLVEPTKRKKKKKYKEEIEQNTEKKEDNKIRRNKKKRKKISEIQDELDSVDIETVTYSEKKKNYLEKAAEENHEASEEQKVQIYKWKKQYEVQECEDTNQEFGESVYMKKKRHRMEKEQFVEVKSEERRKKTEHQESEQIEYADENHGANQMLNWTEQEETCLGEGRKKKHKKKKKKKDAVNNSIES